MLPEPPKPLPPTDLNNSLAPSTPTPAPSMNFAHSLVESEPHAPSSLMDGSDPLTVQTVAPRMRQIYQTQPNSFGLFHCYDKETLPTHDPEDISDDIAGSPPTIAQWFVSIHQVSQSIHIYVCLTCLMYLHMSDIV